MANWKKAPAPTLVAASGDEGSATKLGGPANPIGKGLPNGKRTTPTVATTAVEKKDGGTLGAINDFIKNDAMYFVLIVTIVVFIGYQLGRWVLRRGLADAEDVPSLRNR